MTTPEVLVYALMVSDMTNRHLDVLLSFCRSGKSHMATWHLLRCSVDEPGGPDTRDRNWRRRCGRAANICRRVLDDRGELVVFDVELAAVAEWIGATLTPVLQEVGIEVTNPKTIMPAPQHHSR